jgi:hypothetical protein
LGEHAFRSFVTSASRLEMAGRGSNARSDARQPSRDGKPDDGDFSQRDARAAEQNGGSRRSEKGASAAQLLVQL